MRQQKRRALTVLQTLMAEASLAGAASKNKGEVISMGCQGRERFTSLGWERQKEIRQLSTTGAASHGKPHAHLSLFYVEKTMVPLSDCCASGGWKT